MDLNPLFPPPFLFSFESWWQKLVTGEVQSHPGSEDNLFEPYVNKVMLKVKDSAKW